MNVTNESHPFIFAGCLSIMADNGAINRLEPAPETVKLPYYGNSIDINQAEASLGRLTQEERDTFVFGEESEAREIAARDPHLTLLSVILNTWVGEWL